jgi:hypothetical protein
MAEYPLNPAIGTTVIHCDTHELMIWDGSSWTNRENSRPRGEPELNPVDHMMAECSRYGFIAVREGMSYRISMPFEGNKVDMGYINQDAIFAIGSTEIIDTMLADLWRQAEREIKAYFERR